MIGAFGVKMLFFGAYVAVMLEGRRRAPVPFVASFTGYFIALYLTEALLMRRLFAADNTMLVQEASRNTRGGRARRRREIQRRRDDHPSRGEQQPRGCR
jgi:hypothetical protein